MTLLSLSACDPTLPDAPIGDLCRLHIDGDVLEHSYSECEPINKKKFLPVAYVRQGDGSYGVPIKDMEGYVNTPLDSWANIQIYINTLKDKIKSSKTN